MVFVTRLERLQLNYDRYSTRILVNSGTALPSSPNLNTASRAGATSLRYRFSGRRLRQMLNKIKVFNL